MACIWTVVGFAPWGKAAKIAKKIPAIAKLAKRWRSRSRRLDNAEDRANSARNDRDKLFDQCAGLSEGNSAGSNSFPAGTPVLLADGGSVAIEDVERGDRVLATDPRFKTTRSRMVTDTFATSGTQNMVAISVLAGGSGEQISATGNHPFWVEGLQEWVAAADLEPGHRLRTLEGETATVTYLNEYAQRRTVHNLTVQGLHTYYVSSGGLGASPLVHNGKNKKNRNPNACQYHPAPPSLGGFPKAKKTKPKSTVQGGGKKRARWEESDGTILEWDYQHGTVEKYNKRGKHLGEFDAQTGEQTKPADPNRTTNT